jgi:hypothetical protein
MTKNISPQGVVVTCDHVYEKREIGEPGWNHPTHPSPGCGERFISFAQPSAIDGQLAAAHWIILKVKERNSSHVDKKYLCPSHGREKMRVGTQIGSPAMGAPTPLQDDLIKPR